MPITTENVLPEKTNHQNKAQAAKKRQSIDELRYAEYYRMQKIFDDLYQRSLKGEEFTDLSPIIFSEDNIKLAYRILKRHHGNKAAGLDGKRLKDIGKLSPEEVVEKVLELARSQYGYHPYPIKRIHLPKGMEKIRPAGIGSVWDKLIQQCIKQVLEPICEAKFSNNSYGYRPDRRQSHALAAMYRLMQRQHLHYVIELDIEGFFDHVNHARLKRQIWSMNIHDKELIYLISQIIKTPVKERDGQVREVTEGISQGGVLSPLLANIYLNEFDHWIAGKWQEHPLIEKYSEYNPDGRLLKGRAYRKMRELDCSATCFSISF